MELETTILFRPAGAEESALVEESGWTRWPPRLPEQPIFYPLAGEKRAHEMDAQQARESFMSCVMRKV